MNRCLVRPAVELDRWEEVICLGSAAARKRPHRKSSQLANLKLLDGPKGYAGGKNDMQKNGSKKDESPAELIDAKIEELGDWRGETLAEVRRIMMGADPEIVEEWKWRIPTNPGTPVWSRGGGICTGETYQDKVKLTFFKGAALRDPAGLFNASLGGKVRRAIDIHAGDEIDALALKALVQEAVALNLQGKQ